MKKKIIYGVIAVCVLGGIIGLSVYFALSGGGEIDINGKIKDVDQSGFETQVLPDTRAVVPNGGLRPQGGEETPQPPAPEPTPTPEPEASSTDGAASTTDAQ